MTLFPPLLLLLPLLPAPFWRIAGFKQELSLFFAFFTFNNIYLNPAAQPDRITWLQRELDRSCTVQSESRSKINEQHTTPAFYFFFLRKNNRDCCYFCIISSAERGSFFQPWRCGVLILICLGFEKQWRRTFRASSQKFWP